MLLRQIASQITHRVLHHRATFVETARRGEQAMDELGEFLRRRRRLSSEIFSGSRSPGLRAGSIVQVAREAGVSASYYRALERGFGATPSVAVMRRIADALELDESDRSFALRFAAEAEMSRGDENGARELDEYFAKLSYLPAELHNRNFDIVRTNALMDAMTGSRGTAGMNLVQLFFSRPELRQAPDWREMAPRVVAAFRYYGDPLDPRFRQIAGELLVADKLFRKLWATVTPAPMQSGMSWQNVDDTVLVNLGYQALKAPQGLFAFVLSAEPHTTAQAVLKELETRIAS
jgi:transcriptional regulator with XRE-family HTH domain